MAGKINTSKVLHNSYFSGEATNTDFSQTPMVISPVVADLYDYALTDDIALLHERKTTAEELYEIFNNSPYVDKFRNKDGILIKIPKDNIAEVFNYTKAELEKIKLLTPSELIIAINEFYDFNYDYIYKKVLTPLMKQELLEDYYTNLGMKQRMDNGASEKLF